jgi:hypothetical protein
LICVCAKAVNGITLIATSAIHAIEALRLLIIVTSTRLTSHPIPFPPLMHQNETH